ncbi:glycoprotein-N-acetylgalactosamine 3-beta-galactosyltransferase 1-like [Palaemon carinicauda]|uniref:glycoprotein-N-acetylgalactosamine 3-beta-galactosyltransferase 1-like n=1 Tax=Palaemon carinicauda TaxID=392227 RepID=UPI0035B68A30
MIIERWSVPRTWFHTLLALIVCGILLHYLASDVPLSSRRKSLQYNLDENGHVVENLQDISDNILSSHGADELHHKDEDTVAKKLSKDIRILCWVLTRPENHDKKAKHVLATWGKRCNKLIFMSSVDDPALGAINLNVSEGRHFLWGKTRAAFKYVYDHHFKDYDWFFKGDDDTYVIVENMRYMLSPHDPSYPIYFGSRFKPFTQQGYMSGGGGYVLSKEAVRIFVEKGLPNGKICRQDPGGDEDVEIGKCLYKLGVIAGDSRDSLGRGRYFPLPPVTHLMGNVPKWYLNYVYYKPDTGLNCCSDTPVSFHYVDKKEMYLMEYLLYHARPYGINHRDPFPAPLPPDEKSIPKPILDKHKTSVSQGITDNKTDAEKTDKE